MGDISASNVILTLSVATLFPVPQQIQGFANDEVLDIPQLKSVETLMGVDGLMSTGFVFVQVPHTIALQGDSKSNDVFDTWWMQMQAAQGTFEASGLVIYPSIGKKYVLTQGSLTGYKPLSAAKKLLQPRHFEITWARINPAPI